MRSNRLVATAFSLLVVASACASDGTSVDQENRGADHSGVATEASTTDQAGTTLAIYPDVGSNLLSLLDKVADGRASLLRAEVRTTTADTIVLDATASIGGQDLAREEYAAPVAWEGVSVGDPAMLVVYPDGELKSVAIWDATTGEPRAQIDRWDPIGSLGAPNILDAMWRAPVETCGVPMGEPSYANPGEAITGYVAGETPGQLWDALLQSVLEGEALADSLAESTPEQIDALSGEFTPNDQRSAMRQLVAGVDADAVIIAPTVPVLIDASRLSERVMLAFLDLGSGYYLGWIEVAPGDVTVGQDALVAYFGLPTPGNEVTVMTFDQDDLVGCLTEPDKVERLVANGEVLARVDYDNYAGSRRLRIDASNGDVAGLDSEAFAATFTE